MIILRGYKSVVFWLIFVSLWIVGCDTCCKEKEGNISEKSKEQQYLNNITSCITKSMSSQGKWTFFKIAITPNNKNNIIRLGIGFIISEEYISNAAAENNNIIYEENIINNENEDVILEKINNNNLNAFIVGDSDVYKPMEMMGENANNNNNNEENNNEEKVYKTYHYVLIKDITHKEDEEGHYVHLFRALEETASDKGFTYSIEIIDANTTEVTDMSYMFYEYKALTEMVGLDKWNTTNVTNMSWMFKGCSSLKSLPDISKWNTSNVTNMECIFYDCCSLESLPDISKWNTSNVTNMETMCYNCISLTSLPDISKWNTTNVTDMRFMFYDCFSLMYLPDKFNK